MSSPAAAPPVAQDVVGRVETRGIDVVPAAERHGRPRELFGVWLSANLAYLYLLLGGSLVLLGLNLWQALLVLVAGNLFWSLVGLLAISGPASGVASSVVMRALFGVRGNRLLGSGLGWLTAVGYEAINLAITTFAALALLDEFGVTGTGPLKWIVLLVVAVATFTISIYGHATIVRVSAVLAAALAVCLLVLGGFVIAGAHIGTYVHHGPPPAPVAAVLVGFTVIASGPLSWLTGADFARYLPARTSRVAVAGATAGGGFVAAVLLGLIGILAGTAVDMSDPQSSMRALLPSWFYPLFLAAVVIGTLANNVLTAYCSGLMLQAVGVRASRARTVFLDAVLGCAIALYALYAAAFLTALNNILILSVVYLGPIMAIYAVDLVLRRNAYSGPELSDEQPGSPFWFRYGIGYAGAAAFLAGTAAALLCATTTLWTGPISTAAGGADLSAIVGPVVAGGVYAALYRRSEAFRLRATTRPPEPVP